MGDVIIAAIAPDVVVGLIELLRRLLRTAQEQNNVRKNLVDLRADLGIIKDIVKTINNYNLRNLDGVVGWMEETSGLVNDAKTLLQRIEDQDNCPRRRRRNKSRLHCSRDDARQLDELKDRCDRLAKHNDTILKLVEQQRRPFDWLLCCGRP